MVQVLYQTIKQKILSDLVVKLDQQNCDILSFIAKTKTEDASPVMLENRNYLKALYQDLSPYQVYKKATQVGVTTLSALKALYLIKTRGYNVIYTFPSREDAMLFSTSRLDSILSHSGLSDELQLNNAQFKKFSTGRWYFRGTWSEKQALEIPSDLNIHDELDFSKPDVREVYKRRLDASDYKGIWNIGTPTIPGYGIDKLYSESSMHTWLITCTHCGKNDIELDYFIWKEKGMDDWLCPKCGKVLDRNNGTWVAKYPDREVHGYYIPQTIAPWISFKDLSETEKNITYTKNFYNFNLGLAYSIGDVVLSTPFLLKLVIDEDSVGDVDNVFMGVDQGDELYVVITAVKDGRRIVVWTERCESFDRIENLLEAWRVTLCLIDALPNKHNVRNLVKKYPGRVKMAYYKEQETPIKISESRKAGYHDALLLDRSEVMLANYESYVKGRVLLAGVGSFKTFVDHLSNIRKDEREDRYGVRKIWWTSIGPDHFWHADCYASVVANLRQGKSFDVVDLYQKSKWENNRLSAALVTEELEKSISISPWRKSFRWQ